MQLEDNKQSIINQQLGCNKENIAYTSSRLEMGYGSSQITCLTKLHFYQSYVVVLTSLCGSICLKDDGKA